MGKSSPEVVYDIKHSYTWNPRPGSSSGHNNSKKHTRNMPEESLKWVESEGDQIDIDKIMKDVKCLSSSSMSWKERKKVEDQTVVNLGGKPPKRHRVPLSVAKVPMKRQKQREQNKLEEDMILGKFVKRSKNDHHEKRRPEDRVLKASEGQFRNGVLDVKHLLNQRPPRENDSMNGLKFNKGKNKAKRTGKKKSNKRRR